MDSSISKTIDFVKKNMKNEEAGHNWWHVHRVWKLSNLIANEEKVNSVVVELSALLHDIADYKFNDGNEELGSQKAKLFLETLDLPKKDILHIVDIIANISFKGGNWECKFNSRELDVVRDADRLDAIGAIGIARAFNYGGFKGRELYDPVVLPKLNMTKEEYKANKGPTINHFYEKLLLLKDQMKTKTGRKLAEERHVFMKGFLTQFLKEWEVH